MKLSLRLEQITYAIKCSDRGVWHIVRFSRFDSSVPEILFEANTFEEAREEAVKRGYDFELEEAA